MSEVATNGAAPVTSDERVGELDVLRGFALLGVLIANFVWWSYGWNTTLDAQSDAFLLDPLNVWAVHFTDIFVADKANTLFAFLFGVGFWVQMQRLEQRGAEFGRVYLRRLAVLLVFGIINLWMIWLWDILHLYAVAGMLLFALRKLSARTMLIAGLVLALAGRPVVYALIEASGAFFDPSEMVYSEAAKIVRQDIFRDGTYAQWLAQNANLVWYDWLASGAILAWLAYVLGRMLLGAYVARQGWVQRAGEILPQIRRVFRIALPLGLVLETIRWALEEVDQFDGAPDWIATTLHMTGVPILDIGYATGLILLFHSTRWRAIPLAFAPIGRMALTNYLVQGLFIGFVLYGFHGGLALVGTMQPKVVLPLCFGFFALQMLFSRWWLSRYRFGPMEWLWRTLTYGSRPTMRAVPA